MAGRAVCEWVPPRGLFQAGGRRSNTPNRGPNAARPGVGAWNGRPLGIHEWGIIQLSIKLLLMKLLLIFEFDVLQLLNTRRFLFMVLSPVASSWRLRICLHFHSSSRTGSADIHSSPPVPSLKEPQSTGANFVTIILVLPYLTVKQRISLDLRGHSLIVLRSSSSSVSATCG